MRITRLGAKAFVFYVMLVSAYYAAPYLNLFYLLLAFCTVLAVMNTWWAIRNIRGIEGALDTTKPIAAGSSHVTWATLRCGKRKRFHLGIDVRIDGDIHRVISDFDLEAGAEQRIDVELPALARGVYPIHAARVTTLYPFGLLETSRSIQAKDALVVYPAPADLARHRDRNDASGQGLGGRNMEEMGPAGLREFREGDELRAVHWKASARRRELVIREFEGDTAPGVEIQLDLRTAGTSFEEALSLISALALECKDRKELLTLSTQDHRGTYGDGHLAIDVLLAYLAGVQPLDRSAAAPPSVSPSVLRLPLKRGAHQAGTPNRPQPEGATC